MIHVNDKFIVEYNILRRELEEIHEKIVDICLDPEFNATYAEAIKIAGGFDSYFKIGDNMFILKLEKVYGGKI